MIYSYIFYFDFFYFCAVTIRVQQSFLCKFILFTVFYYLCTVYFFLERVALFNYLFNLFMYLTIKRASSYLLCVFLNESWFMNWTTVWLPPKKPKSKLRLNSRPNDVNPYEQLTKSSRLSYSFIQKLIVRALWSCCCCWPMSKSKL